MPISKAGRLADIAFDPRHVRFTPKSGYQLSVLRCPLVPKADVLLRRCRLPQGRVELVERPIYFVAGYHQWGTDTDGVVVGVLA